MSALEYTMVFDNLQTNKIWSDAGNSHPPIFLYEIDNLLITKDSYPDFTREYSRNLGGPSFFISVYESQFYHFLVDGIAQFLWLKSFIPDLKLYFINDQPSIITEDSQIPKDFVRNMVAWCEEEGYGGEIINLAAYKKVKADKLFLLANSNITFLRNKLDISLSKEDFEIIGDIANNPGIKPIILPPLKEFLFKKALEHNRLPSDFNYPKRVFLRPGLTIERLQAWKDQFDYLNENGLVLDKDFNVIEDPNNALETIKSLVWEHGIVMSDQFGSVFGNMREVRERWLSPEEVKALDDFFSRRDYEFLDSQQMAWIDILNMVIRAEKVAVLAGAGILNAMVAGDETQIIYIDFNTYYDFDHRSTIDLFFVNDPRPIIYYDKREVAKKRYSVQRLLRDLENEKGDYL